MKLNSLDREKAVLSTLILKPDCFYLVRDYLKPFMFSSDFKAIVDFLWIRYEDAKKVDIAILNDTFGSKFISSLLQFTTSTELLEEHGRSVSDSWMVQEFNKAVLDTSIQLGEGKSYSDAQNHLLAQIEIIEGVRINRVNKSEILTELAGDISQQLNNPETIIGVKTAYAGLDKYNLGWQEGLHIVAGRPGMGKTQIMVENALEAAKNGKPCKYFSLGDMSMKQIYKRAAFILAGVNYGQFEDGKLFLPKTEFESLIGQKIGEIGDLPFEVFDNSVLSSKVGDVCHEIFKGHHQDSCSVAFVDYIQQMEPDIRSNNRDENIGNITRKLKSTSQKLKMPIITGSQLSRAVEARGGSKRPIMSDLRESGNIEQDADSIFFVYRPEYYKILEDEEGQSLKGITELINAKNRISGEKTGEVIRLKWKDGRLHTYDQFGILDETQNNPPGYSKIIPPDKDQEIPF